MNSIDFYNEQLFYEAELKIKDAHRLIKLANETEDSNLKKKYLDEAVVGTLPILIKYVKNNKLDMFNGKYFDDEDMLETIIEVWIEKIYSGELLNYMHFSFVFTDRFTREVNSRLLGHEVSIYDYFGVSTKVFIELFSNYTYIRNKGEIPTKEYLDSVVKNVDDNAQVNDFLLGMCNSIYNKLELKDIYLLEKIKSKTRYYLQMFVNLGVDLDVPDGLIQSYDMEELFFKKELFDCVLPYVSDVCPNSRDNEIMRLRFGFDGDDAMTYDEIADKYNLSCNGTRLIVKKRLLALKEKEKIKTYYYK